MAKNQCQFLPGIGGVLTGTCSALLLAAPTQAAETLYIDFGPLSRSIPVDSLETFAETGAVDEHLAFYFKFINPQVEEELRGILSTSPRQVDAVALSQFFYTTMGERALYNAGKVIQTGGRLNGDKAIRSALILTASETDGVAVLDMLKAFPTAGVRIDMMRLLWGIRQTIDEANQTLALVDTVETQSRTEAAQPPPLNLEALPDLTQPGPLGVRYVALELDDRSRDRTYPADLYLPEHLNQVEGPVPILVISHGLGDTRVRFREFAMHVASYGIAVAMPEHIGSNTDQKEDLKQGLESEVFKSNEFLDRPLDISYLLDELERRNVTEFGGKLNVQRVAVVGHSFGGYTAMALGGATIDFARLQNRCSSDSYIVLNAAQLLECQALELTHDPATRQRLGETGVRDDRVQLVMAFAPVTNLFGEQGVRKIQVPTAIFGGAFDIVAPVVPQQFTAFTWLTTSEKYLYLGENTSHGDDLTQTVGRLFNVDRDFDQGLEEGVEWTQGAFKSLLVAFSQVYLNGDKTYEPFLTAAYIEAISQDPFEIHLTREVPEEFLDLIATASQPKSTLKSNGNRQTD